MAPPDTILKLDTLVMIQTKFGFHWSSTFRGEDCWKSLRRTMDANSSHDPYQPIWPLLLKIEHMVKLQVLGNNSKTVNNIKNLTWGKNDQHIKIYLPCNFEVNLITHLGVIASVSYSFWNKGRKVLTFWWKKGNNSRMGNGIYFKIAGWVDLDMPHIMR
jgi:hypothetical protein